MARVFIGLGSNEGDRLANLSNAARSLGRIVRIRLVQMATIREYAPVGPPQANYLNTVVEITTDLSPQELLAICKQLEREMGRVDHGLRWGPRPIDLDILLYGDRVVHDETLTIPHPLMHERRFVLEPLVQLAPEVVHPVLGQTLGELLASLPEVSSRLELSH